MTDDDDDEVRIRREMDFCRQTMELADALTDAVNSRSIIRGPWLYAVMVVSRLASMAPVHARLYGCGDGTTIISSQIVGEIATPCFNLLESRGRSFHFPVLLSGGAILFEKELFANATPAFGLGYVEWRRAISHMEFTAVERARTGLGPTDGSDESLRSALLVPALGAPCDAVPDTPHYLAATQSVLRSTLRAVSEALPAGVVVITPESPGERCIAPVLGEFREPSESLYVCNSGAAHRDAVFLASEGVDANHEPPTTFVLFERLSSVAKARVTRDPHVALNFMHVTESRRLSAMGKLLRRLK